MIRDLEFSQAQVSVEYRAAGRHVLAVRAGGAVFTWDLEQMLSGSLLVTTESDRMVGASGKTLINVEQHTLTLSLQGKIIAQADGKLFTVNGNVG